MSHAVSGFWDDLVRCIFGRGSCRERIDHFARSGIVQFLPGLMLDGIRIVLQPLDMAFQQVVFLPQALQLALQRLRILPFLLIDRKPILSEDDVIAQPNCEYGSSRCGDLSPAAVSPSVQTHDDGLLCLYAR